MDKENYSKYLNHPLWHRKRDDIFSKYGKKCSECPSTKNLEIHHKTYSPDKMPWEYPDENFLVLCEKHHREYHGFEYSFNKCKGKDCGKEISTKFEYCLTCHNNLLKEKETEKKELEEKIAKLEKEKQNKNNRQDKIDQLEKEIKLLRKEKEDADKILHDLKDLNQLKEEIIADNKRIETKVNSLKKRFGIVTAIIVFPIILFVSWFTEAPPKDDKDLSSNEKIVAEKDKDQPTNNTINNLTDNKKNNNVNSDTVSKAETKNSHEVNKNKSGGNNDISTKQTSTIPQSSYKKIVIDEVSSNIGNKIQIFERISQVVHRSNGNVFLNIGGKYPKQKLSLVIFKGNTDNFGDLYEYENEIVKIKGIISDYKGRAEIIINYKWQLQKM
jgi:hypothetical protein